MQYDDATPTTISLGARLALPVRDGGDGDGGDAEAAQAAAAAEAQAAKEAAAQAAAEAEAANAAGGDGDDGKGDSAEVKKLKREAQRLRGERNKLAEAAEADRLAKLSDAEQAKERAEKAEAATAAAQAELATAKIESAVTSEAAKLKFHDPADALALLPKDAITIGDDGKPQGIADALKDLAEAKPHLVNKGGGDAGGALGGNRGQQGDPNGESRQQRMVRLGLARPTPGTSRVSFGGGGVVGGK